MARMLGERLFPESVQARRRSFRERVRGLREPIRQRRMNLVPGPDLVGNLEDRFSDLRSSILDREGFLSDRDGVIESIRARRSGGSGDMSGGDGSGTQNSGSNNQSGEMVT